MISDETINYFKPIVLEHSSFFENLKTQYNKDDISKSANLYGRKYSDLVAEAIGGNISSARVVATLVYNGDYFTQDKVKSREVLYDFACGFKGRTEIYSVYYFCRTILLKERQFDLCHEMLEDLRDIDFLPAFALSGNMQEYGYGTPIDTDKATKYYRAASKNGHLYAKFLLGKLYLKRSNIFLKFYGVVIILKAMLWAFWIHSLGKTPNDERLIY